MTPPEDTAPSDPPAERWGEAIFAHLAQPAAVVDARQRIRLWNQAAATLTGWPPDRVIGLGIGSVLGITPRCFAPVAQQMANGATLPELMLDGRRMGGTALRLRYTAHPLEARNGGSEYLCLFPTVLDASSPSGAADVPQAGDLTTSLRTLLSTLPVPAALVADGVVMFANEEAAENLHAQVGATCCDALCSPHLGECPVRKSARSLSEERWEKLGQGAPANGRREMIARPIPVSGRPAPLILVCAVDQCSDTASAELRKFFRAVDQNTAGVLLTDADGQIEYANPRCSEIVGRSPVELIGRPVFRDATAAGEATPPFLGLPRPADSGSGGEEEIIHVRPDGKTVHLRYTVSNLRDEGYEITHWVVVIDDITERSLLEQGERALRDQLAHTSRLAAVGEMATVIAHEINQPLSNIANFSAGCIRRLDSGQWQVEPLVEALNVIAKEVGRAGDIVRNVRSFARRGDAIHGSIDVNEIIREVMPLVSALSRRQRVNIELDLDASQPKVSGDRTQIEQIMINLIRNAIEAMADTADRERTVKVRTRIDPQQRVWVAVEDAGCGMDDAALRRLGEPFLTTKPHGLGLGLSITRTLLEAHGSRLDAVRNPGRGMTFFFSLTPPPQ